MITPILCCIASSLAPLIPDISFLCLFVCLATIYFVGIGRLELLGCMSTEFWTCLFPFLDSLFFLLYLGNLCLPFSTDPDVTSFTAPRPLFLTCWSHDSLGPESKEPSSALHQLFYPWSLAVISTPLCSTRLWIIIVTLSLLSGTRHLINDCIY